MHWYIYPAYFFGGAFLANASPHLINGVSGRPFQTPFAKPPGKGLSSSTVNVIWGFFNILLSWLLIFRVGSFDLYKVQHALVFGTGVLMMSVISARIFGPLHGGK
ncbi:hypothetical protein P8935_10415 [Telmatobacter sp. DSM 110680]|uniref:Uncharacterized protein n=1 Tax=Telmatobacter sp. DSM 110680 TaxID=3036704 RepID=A0AAU7DRU7_9BACT